jgi:AraC-like DNA-binding protein
MTTRDIFTDLTNLTRPLPECPGGDADDDQLDGWRAWAEEVDAEREAFERNLRLSWEHQDDYDPLLDEIAAARSAMLEAEKRMRLLIAYGREFIEPRPYKLDDLARAAGMSISGVRTAYDDDEIIKVARLTGAKLRRRTEQAS